MSQRAQTILDEMLTYNGVFVGKDTQDEYERIIDEHFAAETAELRRQVAGVGRLRKIEEAAAKYRYLHLQAQDSIYTNPMKHKEVMEHVVRAVKDLFDLLDEPVTPAPSVEPSAIESAIREVDSWPQWKQDALASVFGVKYHPKPPVEREERTAGELFAMAVEKALSDMRERGSATISASLAGDGEG